MISSQEIQKKATRAFLVGIHHQKMSVKESADLLDELRDMVENLDIAVVGNTLVNLRSPSPALYVGSGKAETILEQARAVEADVLVFDDDLSPVQQRNWEAQMFSDPKVKTFLQEEGIIFTNWKEIMKRFKENQ